MEDFGLVSIIIPTYNYGHLIHETLDCVLEGAYQNWECIVVDDGSKDNTKEVVEGYTLRDSRIRYVYQRNGGLSAARNAGIRQAKGAFIQLLDSDDLIQTEKLRSHSKYLQENTTVDLVYSSVRYFIPGEPALRYSMFTPDLPWEEEPESDLSGYWLKKLLRQNQFVVNGPLIRRIVFDRAGYFDEGLSSVEDWDLWCRCLCKGIVFRKHNTLNSFALVRMHQGSMSTNKTRMILNALKVRRKLDALILSSYPAIMPQEQNELIEINRRETRNQHRMLAEIFTAEGKTLKAISHVLWVYLPEADFVGGIKAIAEILRRGKK